MAEPVDIEAALAAPPPAAAAGPIDIEQALRAASPQELRAAPAETKIHGGPLVVDSGDKAAGFWTQLRAGMPPSHDDQIKRFAEARGLPTSRYGTDHEGNIVYWDPTVNKGNGGLVRETPSVAGSTGVADAVRNVGLNVAKEVPAQAPGAAGAAAGLAASGSGPGSILAAGGAAAGADILRQVGDRWLSGEWSPAAGTLKGGKYMPDLDYWNAAGQGAMAAGGQALGLGGAKLFNRNGLGIEPWERLAAQSPETAQHAAEINRLAETYGVDLSAGQSTGLKGLQAKERALATYPETADDAYQFVRDQRRNQVPEAIRKEIGNVSDLQGEAGTNAFRAGAVGTEEGRVAPDSVMGQQLAERSRLAKTAYDEAFKANPSVTSPMLDKILDTPGGNAALRNIAVRAKNKMELLAQPDPELTDLAREVLGRGAVPKQGVADGLSLRTLDMVKRELYDMEQTASRAAANGSDPARQDMLAFRDLRQRLTGELDRLDKSAVPAGPAKGGGSPHAVDEVEGEAPAGDAVKGSETTGKQAGAYAKARLQFGDSSDVIDQMRKGGLGFMERLKDASPMDRIGIVRSVFDAGQAGSMTAEEVGRMRASYSLAGKGKEWDAGVATWMHDKLDQAIKAAGDGGNVPSQFLKLTGLSGAETSRNPAQQRVLEAALGNDPARVKGFKNLFTVLEASAKGLPEGSSTMANANQIGALGLGDKVGAVRAVAGTVLNPKKWLDAGEDLLNAAARRAQLPKLSDLSPDDRMKLMSKLLHGDVTSELRNLSVLSPTGEKAAEVAGQILTRIGVGGVERLTGAGKAPEKMPTSRPVGESAGQR